MKWEQIQSNWKNFTPQVLAQWNRLTDEQVKAVAGKRETLAMKIQEVVFEERAKEPQEAKAPASAKPPRPH